MSLVAEFTTPPESFPFGRALVEVDDVEIEVDQIVPTGESALPFFWVRGCDPGEFLTYAERDPDVRETERLELVDEVALFRAEWRLDADLVAGLRELPVTLVEAVGTADHWRFEIRAQERDTVRAFRSVFDDAGVRIDLNRMYELSELIDDDRLTLTSNQRETLITAFRDGYFDQPRQVTQEELAERFGISRRAVSDRLRRGVRNLVADELIPDAEEDGSP